MNTVRTLMQQGLNDGVFPGAVLLVAREAKVVFHEAFGLARLSPHRPMTLDTAFDLASLTKPLATTLAVMLLVQHEKVGLDDALGSRLPSFAGTALEEISIRHLLSHTSGLPAYRAYYESLMKAPRAARKAGLRAMLLAEKPLEAPGQVCLYSDLGFMILEWLVEIGTKKFFDRLMVESIYGPLGLRDLFFVPINGYVPMTRRSFAATEECPWRQKVMDGEVHDDNAYAVGGVAGHAGLFGTARDVHRLLNDLMSVYLGKPTAGLFRGDIVRAFFQRQSHVGTWALGFDTPSRPDSSSGKYFSDRSVGHLGFTGTSFWMDLEKGVIVVLLTNRIHPSRVNDKIRGFRPQIHDEVMNQLGFSSHLFASGDSQPRTSPSDEGVEG